MRILDLFCGPGGACRGLQAAGWDVEGIDLDPTVDPFYPGHLLPPCDWRVGLDTWGCDADAIWASPPCQAYSRATPTRCRPAHPDLVAAVRAALAETGKPYILENVPGSPIVPTVRLYGWMFGLNVLRERWFETNWPATAPQDVLYPPRPAGHTVCPAGGGGGNGHGGTAAEWRAAMGLDLPRRRIVQCVPPAYAEHLGRQLAAYLRERGGA